MGNIDTEEVKKCNNFLDTEVKQLSIFCGITHFFIETKAENCIIDVNVGVMNCLP